MRSRFSFSIPYKWEVMIWLWFAYFLGQGDRQVFNTVLPLIRDDLLLNDTQMGLIAAVLIAVLALTIPFAGWIGDQFNQTKIIVFSILCWSSVGLLMGFSTGIWHLLLLRSIAASGGEAFYSPSSNALIAYHHRYTRSLALSIHQTALYVGVVSSGWIAGYLGENYGWQTSFLIFGILGILLAIILRFRLKSPSSVSSSSPTLSLKEAHQSFLASFKVILSIKTALLLTLAFAAMVFATVAFVTWMPTYLHESYNMSLSQAGFHSMFWHHLAAFGGVMLGAYVSDKWSQTHKFARLDLEILALVLAAPFIVLMGLSQNMLWMFIGIAGFGFFRGIYDANIFAAIFDVIPPKYRATCVAVMGMVAFLIASLGPLFIGYLKPTLGLGKGLALMGLVYLIGAVLVWVGRKWYFAGEYIG